MGRTSSRLVAVIALCLGFTGGMAAVGVASLAPEPVVLIGGSVTGVVTPSNPRYQNVPLTYVGVDCPATWAIRIDVTSSWDNVAYLFDPSGKHVEYSDDGNFRDARIEYTCPVTGRYRIGVGAAVATTVGEFTLAVSRTDGGPGQVAAGAATGRGAAPPPTVPGALPTAGAPGVRSEDAMALAYRTVFGEPSKDICWKGSYGRGVGEIGKGCPAGMERTGADLLCYPKCQAGYTGVGPVCWQECPAGSTDLGLTCSQVNRSCPAGTNLGLLCSRGSYGRGVGTGVTCLPGQEQDFRGGLCYPRCRPGMNGAGPVCWGKCSGEYPVDCGAGCATDAATCALTIMDQVMSTGEVALNAAVLVGTFGAGSTPLRAAQVGRRTAMQAGIKGARKLEKIARNQVKGQIRERLDSIAVRQARYTGGRDGYLTDTDNRDRTAELLTTATESGDFDFLSLAPSVADVEPTGILSVVAAFNKPLCQPMDLPPDENVAVAPRREGEACAEAPACETGLYCHPVFKTCRVETPILGPIAVGQTVSNTLRPRATWNDRPMEFYRLQCQAGLRVRISASAQYQPVIVVADTGLNQLALNDRFVQGQARLDYECGAHGVVYVGAGSESRGISGPYSLSIGQERQRAVTGGITDADRQAPVAAEGPRTVTLGQTVSGRVRYDTRTSRTENVYFNYACVAGQRVTIAAQSSAFNNFAEVLDMAGNRLAYGGSGDGTNARFDFTCPTSANVRVGVGAEVIMQEPNATREGPFALSVRAAAGGAPAPASVAVRVAGTARIAQVATSGRVAPDLAAWNQRPAVFFQMSCLAQRPLEISADASFDAVAWVLSMDGGVLATNDDHEGTKPRIIWVCPDAGTYLVGVSSKRMGEGGDIALWLDIAGGSGGGRALGLIIPGETVHGTLNDASSRWGDYRTAFWAFDCRAGTAVSLRASASWAETVILDRFGEFVSWGGDWTCPKNAVYRVGIRSRSSGAFTLTLDRR